MIPTPPAVRPIVLIVGEDRPETPLRYLARGLRDAGWEVGQIDVGRYGFQSRSLSARIAGRLTSRLLQHALSNDIAARIVRSRPDVIVFVKVMPLSPKQVDYCKRAGIKLAVWYPDVSFDHEGVAGDFLRAIDIFITTKSYHLTVGKSHPDLQMAFIPHGYCDDVHYPLRATTPEFDIVYVGNHSAFKESKLRVVSSRRPDLKMLAVGHGWGHDHPWSVMPNVVGEEMSRAIGNSKIALGIHYGHHGSEGWSDLVSARTFEIPACGTFLLHPDNAEVRGLFEPDREIGVFDTDDDMVAQIDRWLAADAEREAATERAMRRARPAYGYRARGVQIASFLSSLEIWHQ